MILFNQLDGYIHLADVSCDKHYEQPETLFVGAVNKQSFGGNALAEAPKTARTLAVELAALYTAACIWEGRRPPREASQDPQLGPIH